MSVGESEPTEILKLTTPQKDAPGDGHNVDLLHIMKANADHCFQSLEM